MGVFPYLVVVGAFSPTIRPSDQEIMSIHVCNALNGEKAHKRWDSENDLD